MPSAKARLNETLAEVVAREGTGFTIDEVKAYPKNSGLLKARSEFILKEGDTVWFPEEEPELEWFSTTVGSELRLTVGATRPFKLILHYPDRSLVANQAFKLTVDGREYEGTTDGAGLMEVEVPMNATHGMVRVEGYKQALEIGALEPVHTAKGLQARLRNLGYAVGPIDGELGPRSTRAIRQFQKDYELPVNGKAGPATRDKLKARHGC